ncbi:hypothetical protein B484DRAFT_454590 [Ochromonadaceae sp. CCMP2298]|nr:hypothetical protein B484DRAFT_454590 [Ochromonadaceae sp. CCMP2298]|mmetsp:Transcript_10783/g.23875  ORF Transcript_10783/g.23875 Transcript_10783/m.23875 type:complete len:212 (+) Transcript_10783:162-797(+)
MNRGSSVESWKSVNVTPTLKSQPKPNAAAIAAMKQDAVQPRLRLVTDPSKLPTPTALSATAPHRAVQANRHQPNRLQETRKVNSRDQAKGGPPQYVGSTFTHLPNAPNRVLLPLPKNAKLAQPYPVFTSDTHTAQPLLHSRSPDGKILGSPGRRYVEGHRVPYLAPDEPLGPDNPVKELSETWTACWDKEAGASYYYNKVSGEATWLPPEL